ncbi:MAG: molybdenum cofactor biosynthesis protein B [Prochloraceae cyanobacterium]
MTSIPHPDLKARSISCAVITVSDTRTLATDRSGKSISQLLEAAGHEIKYYSIVKDEPEQIKEVLLHLSSLKDLEALIFNGGTGIAPRDTTYDAISSLLEKTLPGFGELFRFLSYQEIGSRAIASRSVAGIYAGKLVFSLPGSTNAVKLALSKLILPELVHLVRQLKGE